MPYKFLNVVQNITKFCFHSSTTSYLRPFAHSTLWQSMASWRYHSTLQFISSHLLSVVLRCSWCSSCFRNSYDKFLRIEDGLLSQKAWDLSQGILARDIATNTPANLHITVINHFDKIVTLLLTVSVHDTVHNNALCDTALWNDCTSKMTRVQSSHKQLFDTKIPYWITLSHL
jgi:hypothetical protein